MSVRITAAALVALTLISTGCATVTSGAGPDQKVRISSEPRGAAIHVDGQYKGVTPQSVEMTRKDNHTVRLELAGYQSHEQELKSGVNPMIFGNILIGGLVGVTTDLISGANIALSPGEVNATLTATTATTVGALYPPATPVPAAKPEYYPSGIIK
jgi:hypothetical protein